jgi:hypothetical protein
VLLMPRMQSQRTNGFLMALYCMLNIIRLCHSLQVDSKMPSSWTYDDMVSVVTAVHSTCLLSHNEESCSCELGVDLVQIP